MRPPPPRQNARRTSVRRPSAYTVVLDTRRLLRTEIEMRRARQSTPSRVPGPHQSGKQHRPVDWVCPSTRGRHRPQPPLLAIDGVDPARSPWTSVYPEPWGDVPPPWTALAAPYPAWHGTVVVGGNVKHGQGQPTADLLDERASYGVTRSHCQRCSRTSWSWRPARLPGCRIGAVGRPAGRGRRDVYLYRVCALGVDARQTTEPSRARLSTRYLPTELARSDPAKPPHGTSPVPARSAGHQVSGHRGRHVRSHGVAQLRGAGGLLTVFCYRCRTGTKTLNQALTILLDGPVHDSGIQSLGGSWQEVLRW